MRRLRSSLGSLLQAETRACFGTSFGHPAYEIFWRGTRPRSSGTRPNKRKSLLTLRSQLVRLVNGGAPFESFYR